MLSARGTQYLQEILSYIKFSFDRKNIKKELEGHLSDKIEYYMERGYDRDRAEQLTIKDMGDAGKIGEELNRQHNPVLGWLWMLTNAAAVVTGIIFCMVFLSFIGNFIHFDDFRDEIPASDIAYQIDVNEKVRIDDRIIHFTGLIQKKNGDINVFYEYYDVRLWGTGWTLGNLGEITDDNGNKYISGQGQESGGVIKKGVWTVKDFSSEADCLNITYDRYNREYQVEIQMKAGKKNE